MVHFENGRDLEKIIQRINRVTKFNAHYYRLSTLRRRLQLRLQATKSKCYRDYLSFIKKDSAECFKFVDVLTINVTEFFRDKRVFLTLKKKILPGLLEATVAKKRKRIRIWSIGCSKGQEPYSLAIIMDELAQSSNKKIAITIHGTDVNREVLKQAKKACFRLQDLKNVPRRYINNFVQKINNNDFTVKFDIRKLVKFKHHDFITGSSLGKFDLIMCRNLFIFIEPHFQEELLKKIHASLRKEGILVLGTAEAATDETLFRYISSRQNIYQKIE